MTQDDRQPGRKHRIARNEALFREVNERVLEVSGDAAAETTDFLCECGHGDCTETIALRNDEYENVRKDPLLFVIVPGHVIPDVEDLVAENERFAVVRKHLREGLIARKTDPRS